MATPADNDDGTWAPAPDLPNDPEFYRRVLKHMPSPLLVVNDQGTAIYHNQALIELGGWDPATDGFDVFQHIHPEDRDGIAAAFAEIIESPGARVLGNNRPWAEIYFRIVTADGNTVPVELVGTGGMLDPHVGGVIYEVRPARWRDLMGRVLDGLSQGASMHYLLSLVARIVTMPPLDLQAVVLQSSPSDNWVVAASTSPVLTETLRGSSRGLPWHNAMREPSYVDINDLPARVRAPLREAGFQDLWHVSVESPLTANTLRILAASPTHHVPSTGPRSRLLRTRGLGAAVLLRSAADVLLQYAAAHDQLTQLPNRAAFYQLADAIDPLGDRAAIQVDLDGLQRVNLEHGRASGDAILQIVADRIGVLCDPTDLIGRVGDDDFAIVLSKGGPDGVLERSLQLARLMFAAIQEPIVVAGKPLHIRCSVGVAIAPSGIGTDHLLTWADAAMHDAKSLGGGQICRYGVTLN